MFQLEVSRAYSSFLPRSTIRRDLNSCCGPLTFRSVGPVSSSPWCTSDQSAYRPGRYRCISKSARVTRLNLAMKGDRIVGSSLAAAAVGGDGVTSKQQTLGAYELTDPVVIDGNHSLPEPGPSESPVLHRLKQGFVHFKEEKFNKETELFSKLAASQQPKVMVIACCDSRVCPTLLMGLEPGEVFTLRNVANLVPPQEKEGVYHGTSAALEFAVTGLQVEHIIVLGHSSCGGVKALMQRSDFSSDFIGRWMKIALPAKARTLDACPDQTFKEQCRFCEQESINVSLGNLLTFPWLEERFKDGQLSLHGWYYDFVDGSMTSWEVSPPSRLVANSQQLATA